jgi:hypothetical protein
MSKPEFMSEHDFEPVRGLPGVLPAGETILWQCAPRWFDLATQAFHIRAVATYFTVMLVWRTVDAVAHGQAAMAAIQSALSVAPLAALSVAILAGLAWLNSRTTVYTITNKRVVLRFGAAVSKAINIPFAIIDSAALKAAPDGAGDLALTLKAPNRLAFLHIWPHARPWRMAAPQPTLRALPNAAAAAALLADAMRAEVPIALTRAAAAPARPLAPSKVALA